MFSSVCSLCLGGIAGWTERALFGTDLGILGQDYKNLTLSTIIRSRHFHHFRLVQLALTDSARHSKNNLRTGKLADFDQFSD